MNILDLDIVELTGKVKSGDITSRQVIESYFENIEKVEEEVNAFISLDKELALEKADKIDAKLEAGEELGSLAGVPISIKDNILTKDFKTTAGSKMLENFISPYNASLVEKIEAQDGIIIGKTNMDEFAMGNTTEYSIAGPTKNPIDKTRTAGGSSGGSAASVAAKEALVSIASDTGGSVRQPASYCGLVGLKPSYGRISRNGLIALSDSLDSVGIIARTTEDAALMMQLLSGKDEKDPTSIDADEISLDCLNSELGFEDLKIAIPKQFIRAETSRENQAALNQAVNQIQDMGASIEEVDMPILDYLVETYQAITSGDISSNMARYDGIIYGHRAEDYEDLDELYMNTRSEGFGDEAKKRILFGSYILSGDRGRDYYDRALKIRRLIVEEFDKLYEEYDLVISLTSGMRANKLTEVRNKAYSNSETMFNVAANLAGLCAITVPTPSTDLPIGLQFMGDRFEEEVILRAAAAYERMID